MQTLVVDDAPEAVQLSLLTQSDDEFYRIASLRRGADSFRPGAALISQGLAVPPALVLMN